LPNNLEPILENRIVDLTFDNIRQQEFVEIVLADLYQDAPEIYEQLEIEDPLLGIFFREV
jgi:hypothetical protein